MKNRNDTASGLRHQEAGHGSALFATLAAAIIVAVLAFSPAKAFASGSGRPGGQAGALHVSGYPRSRCKPKEKAEDRSYCSEILSAYKSAKARYEKEKTLYDKTSSEYAAEKIKYETDEARHQADLEKFNTAQEVFSAAREEYRKAEAEYKASPSATDFVIRKTHRPVFLATMYGEGDPARWDSMPEAIGLSGVRITDIVDNVAPDQATSAADKWEEVDSKISHYKAHGRFAVLDLSFFRNLMVKSGIDPYAESSWPMWDSFLEWIAARYGKNTGIKYVDIAGEPEWGASQDKLIPFYRHTMEKWRSLSAIPVSTGGFINYGKGQPHEGLGEKLIKLGITDHVNLHVYSQSDLEALRNGLADRVHALGGYLLVEEMGIRDDIDLGQAGERPDSSRTDAVIAKLLIERLNEIASSGADIVGMWNVSGEDMSHGFVINSETMPITAQALKNWSLTQSSIAQEAEDKAKYNDAAAKFASDKDAFSRAQDERDDGDRAFEESAGRYASAKGIYDEGRSRYKRAELTYKAMERRYRKAEKQCTQAGTAEGGGSLSRTGTGAIAVIQTSALLAVFAVLGFAVKRFGRYHSRYRSR